MSFMFITPFLSFFLFSFLFLVPPPPKKKGSTGRLSAQNTEISRPFKLAGPSPLTHSLNPLLLCPPPFGGGVAGGFFFPSLSSHLFFRSLLGGYLFPSSLWPRAGPHQNPPYWNSEGRKIKKEKEKKRERKRKREIGPFPSPQKKERES